MKKVGLILLIGIFLSIQCSLKLPSESDYPSWSINLNVPLTDQTITIDDLLTDSLIVKLPYGSNDSIYAYQDEFDIDEVRVGNKLNIDDITQSIQQGVDNVTVEGSNKRYTNAFSEVGVDPIGQNISNTIGKITLDDTDPEVTDPIALAEIIDLSGVPEGSSASINQSTAFPVIERQISFDNFEQADLTDGILDIKIANDLVVELGAPLSVRLLNASDYKTIVGSDGDSAIATWNTGIPSGQSATASINLQGKILPGTLIVQVSGVICGSAPTNIVNNATSRNSAFVVEVQARNLEVTSAKAKIPAQTIDTTSVISLDPTEPNKVKQAVIQEGRLRLLIDNALPIDANLELTITSLKTSSSGGTQPFTATINLPAKQVTQREYNLASDILEMDLVAQEINYYYTIRTIPTDPNLVTVKSDDSVKVAIDLYGTTAGEQITFAEIEGIIEPQDISDNGEINTSSSARITAAAIALGSLSITVENHVNLTSTGLPRLKLDLPQILGPSNVPVSLEIDLLPGENTFSLDLANHQIQPLSQPVSADSVRQYITYQSRVTTPAGQLARYDLTDSVNINITISDITFQSITGYFDQEPIVTQDSIELKEKTKLSAATIMNGDLVLTLTNHIGVIADVVFTVDEILHRSTGQKFTYTIHLPNNPAPVIETIPLKDYQIVLPFVDQNTNQLIHYSSKVSVPSDQEMTLTTNEKIEVDVKLAGLEFQRVQGYIDPVQVDIEKVEQEITALPNEFNGINLKNVTMRLEFETNIGVPVELHLDITAKAENGDSVHKAINQVITTDPIVVVPNAEDLINIKPKTIVASGYALVGGVGQVDTSQYVKGKMQIVVPFEMEITPNAKINVEPALVKADIPEQIESGRIYAEVSKITTKRIFVTSSVPQRQ